MSIHPSFFLPQLSLPESFTAFHTVTEPLSPSAFLNKTETSDFAASLAHLDPDFRSTSDITQDSSTFEGPYSPVLQPNRVKSDTKCHISGLESHPSSSEEFQNFEIENENENENEDQANNLKGWSEEDTKLLRVLVKQYRYDWKRITKAFQNNKYTPFFLKKRFKGIEEGFTPKNVKFSHEEDVRIAKYFDLYGMDWGKMVDHFPNRTAMMLKNRYYSFIKKNGRFEALLEEVQKPERESDFKENDSVSVLEEEQPASEKVQLDEVEKLKMQVKSLRSAYILAQNQLRRVRNEKFK